MMLRGNIVNIGIDSTGVRESPSVFKGNPIFQER